VLQLWFLYALGVFTVWGAWGFFHKLSTLYLDPRSALIYESCGAVFVGIWVLVSLRFSVSWHPVGALFAFLSGLSGVTGALCFLYAVTTGGRLSVVVTLTALYPIVTIALSALFLKEPISMSQGIGIILALVAIAFLAH
jgi:bacterial/archaeal transporter family protein